MNRIIIIGNGFDKSYGLPTGYADFMTHLKDSIAIYEKNGSGYSLKNNGYECKNRVNYFHRKNQDGTEDNYIGIEKKKNELNFKFSVNPHEKTIYFQSLFKKNEELGHWSDLESHYFKTLYEHRENVENIKLINKEFEHLKYLLKEYLINEVENKIGTDFENKITNTNNLYQIIKHTGIEKDFEKNFFITFNYTSKILNQYYFWLRDSQKNDKYSSLPIHIHGNLTSIENPIIFGYGDENSLKYKDLESLENDELLINFKTFQYLRSSRYKQILGLLEDTEEIYVQIIGHSCGLCDKSLLKTIFEHKNVKHIEAIYHGNESKYFEKLYNISRIFDDNNLMREKIIPLQETNKI